MSLLSLSTALAVAAVLGGITLRGVHTLQQRGQRDAALQQLQQVVQLTRATALTHGAVITLCPRQQGRCGEHWERGYMVFADSNANRTLDPGETLLHHEQALPGKPSLRWRASGGRNYLRFSARGTAMEFGFFLYCPTQRASQQGAGLRVNRQGRQTLLGPVTGARQRAALPCPAAP